MSRRQQVLLVLLTAALAASCVAPPYPDQMWLQHLPTLIAIAALPPLARRFPLSDAAFACVIGFLLLHVLGARYIYSYVPYDRWVEALFGHGPTAAFGWRRNHYDRLVHLGFGLLAVRPAWELCCRHFRVSRRFALFTAVQFVLAASLLYEVFEWGLTLLLAPADAGAYNGEQGDVWDAQKDMALALLGSLLAALPLLGRRRDRGPWSRPRVGFESRPPSGGAFNRRRGTPLPPPASPGRSDSSRRAPLAHPRARPGTPAAK